jgi:hypothetical protein
MLHVFPIIDSARGERNRRQEDRQLFVAEVADLNVFRLPENFPVSFRRRVADLRAEEEKPLQLFECS